MLHVNIFIIIGSLCAGLCDTATALRNLYYVLERDGTSLKHNIVDQNGSACRLRSLSISSPHSPPPPPSTIYIIALRNLSIIRCIFNSIQGRDRKKRHLYVVSIPIGIYLSQRIATSRESFTNLFKMKYVNHESRVSSAEVVNMRSNVNTAGIRGS